MAILYNALCGPGFGNPFHCSNEEFFDPGLIQGRPYTTSNITLVVVVEGREALPLVISPGTDV
jgi:hypothetical protein